MTILPEPSFIDRDPAAILADAMTWMETELGRTLEPAQVETLLVRFVAYRETLIRIGVNEAAKQNLLAYARYPMIDFLGELVGAPRLAARGATCVMRVVPNAVPASAELVPAGTLIRSLDGRVVFATRIDVINPAGVTHVEVEAVCLTTGVVGNDYAIGAIAVLESDLGFAATAFNVDVTSGGAPEEATEDYRARIPTTVDAASAAGPGDAYRALALRAHPDVIDAYASRPSPGVVSVAVLGRTGVPSGGVVTAVDAYLNAPDRHQLLAEVSAVAASAVNYSLHAELELESGVSGALAASVLLAAQAAAAEYAAGIRRRLRTSPVASQVTRALHVPGVYRVTLLADPELVLTYSQFAHASSVSVTLA